MFFFSILFSLLLFLFFFMAMKRNCFDNNHSLLKRMITSAMGVSLRKLKSPELDVMTRETEVQFTKKGPRRITLDEISLNCRRQQMKCKSQVSEENLKVFTNNSRIVRMNV